MDKVVIVGSGVGYSKPETVRPEYNFNDLKEKLSDPIEYFLGNNFEAVIFPDDKSEYYGFPPSKNHVFANPSTFKFQAKGFEPLFSFAQGGLAEAWTGGAFPFNNEELVDFPFSYEDIEPHYNEVAKRIGICGENDDLATFYPFHGNIMSPLDLDQHSRMLLNRYQQKKTYFNNQMKCFMGRSRIAVLSRDKGQRKGCNYSGRCLCGCPEESLYTPSITLKQCMAYPGFEYVPQMFVTQFKVNSRSRITSVIAKSLKTKVTHEISLDKLVLAAGTLCSSKIFMDSIFNNTGDLVTLRGLMDNRQILVPFINLKLAGKKYNPETYMYHQVNLCLKADDPKKFIHGLITTLKTAMIHPIIQKIPSDFKTSGFIFRNLHSALGVLNVNFHDQRREHNTLSLEQDDDLSKTRLMMNYSPDKDERVLISQTLKHFKKVFRKLGCVIPSPMVHKRPMGASVHYSGTIPMSRHKSTFTTSEMCQSHDFENLFIADGTTIPFLPAKNLTFTLMANAVRIAENAF